MNYGNIIKNLFYINQILKNQIQLYMIIFLQINMMKMKKMKVMVRQKKIMMKKKNIK